MSNSKSSSSSHHSHSQSKSHSHSPSPSPASGSVASPTTSSALASGSGAGIVSSSSGTGAGIGAAASGSGSGSGSGSKLPKFLHRNHHGRDRSRSFAQDGGGNASSAESEADTSSRGTSSSSRPTRKGSKLFSSSSSGPGSSGSGSASATVVGAGGQSSSSVKLNSSSNFRSGREARAGSGSSAASKSVDIPATTPEQAATTPTSATTTRTPTIAVVEPSSPPQSRPEPPSTPSHSEGHSRHGLGALVSRSRTISVARPISLSTLESYNRLRSNGNSAGQGSPARLAEISGRLSGWFQQTFSSSSTDLTTLSLPPSTSTPTAPTHALGRSLPASASASSSTTSHATTASPKAQKSRNGSSSAASIMSHMPGKANLERAVRWVFDSDVAQPDKCTDPIWIMGVEHPGYTEPLLLSSSTSSSLGIRGGGGGGLTPTQSRDSTDSRASSYVISPTNSRSTPSTSLSTSPSQHVPLPTSPSAPRTLTQGTLTASPTGKEVLSWPPAFYDDFTSRIWLTYRRDYAPIRDSALTALSPPIALDQDPALLSEDERWERSSSMAGTSPPKPRWAWGGEKTWTADTGWGCMLRTGQSVLAEALVHLHLGRDWRRPQNPSMTAEYAMYVKIISWFLDTPSPLVPFGVHRMALAGKDLGKEVGSWFGPSTAAGAIKTLVNAFPEAGLSAAVAVDGTLYETDVYAASNVLPPHHVPKHEISTAASLSSGFSRRKNAARRRWGGQAVLVLIGVRLGIDSVNPVYHESVKKLFTFPQSVGIAGGRPSSSYYFIGYQADHLYYLDPHHTRPAVPLQPLRDASKPPPPSVDESAESSSSAVDSSYSPSTAGTNGNGNGSSPNASSLPPSTSSGFRNRRKGKEASGSLSSDTSASPSTSSIKASKDKSKSKVATSPESSASSIKLPLTKKASTNSSFVKQQQQQTPPQKAASPPPTSTNLASSSEAKGATPPSKQAASAPSPTPASVQHTPSQSSSSITLDPTLQHYAKAYSPVDLKTYHCPQVRKMPISGLDPSMLLAFLCRDELDWKDLRARVTELGRHRAIFSIQDEHPTYGDDSDSDVGMQSVSEPGSDISTSDEHTFESTSGEMFELDDTPEVPDVHDEADANANATGAGVSVSNTANILDEMNVKTPSQTPQAVEFYPFPPGASAGAGNNGGAGAQGGPVAFPAGGVSFPGSGGDGDGFDDDDDDDWVTPTPQPSSPRFPRRTHLRSQSLAAPTIRPQVPSTATATAAVPSR